MGIIALPGRYHNRRSSAYWNSNRRRGTLSCVSITALAALLLAGGCATTSETFPLGITRDKFNAARQAAESALLHHGYQIKEVAYRVGDDGIDYYAFLKGKQEAWPQSEQSSGYRGLSSHPWAFFDITPAFGKALSASRVHVTTVTITRDHDRYTFAISSNWKYHPPLLDLWPFRPWHRNQQAERALLSTIAEVLTKRGLLSQATDNDAGAPPEKPAGNPPHGRE